MVFVPEGQPDRSGARSAWEHEENSPVLEGRLKRCQSQRYLSLKLSSCRFRNASVLSPKYEVFCRRSVGCFSRRERSAHIRVIRVERATRKNSQLAPAQRVAMKMGRRLRCSSVTYRFRYAPSSRLAGGPF